MKRYLAIIVMLLSWVSIYAQDLIILTNGEKIEAKITEVSETEIRYKKWNNLTGPTMVKSVTAIDRIKYQKDRLLKQRTFKEGEQWDFVNCSSTSTVQSASSRYISGNEIVSMVDFYYFNSQKDKINPYIEKLPTNINRECVHHYYYEQFLYACDNENENDILKYGETYLLVGGEEELSTILPILAKVQAARGNESEVEKAMTEFEHYSKANDGLFDDDIAQLRLETHELLHPYRFENDLVGKWVLLDKVRFDGMANYSLECPLILDIDKILNPNNTINKNGAHLIVPGQVVTKRKVATMPQTIYYLPINTSQSIFCDAESHYAAFQFASMLVKDRRGNTDFVHSALETTRNLRADMNATIITSDASFEDKMAAAAITAVTTATMDAIFSRMNTSSKTDEVYNFVLYPKSKNVMNAMVSHISVTTKTTTTAIPSSNYNEYVKDKKTKMVRWEEEDHVYFVSRNGEPITLSSVNMDDPMLQEYRDIKRRYSFLDPRYCIPMVGGNLIGIAFMEKGIRNLINDWGCDDQMVIAKDSLLAISGYVVVVIINTTIPARWMNKRREAYMELNRRNIEKLRRKDSPSLSLIPNYDPAYNAIGASIDINF